MGHCQSLYLQTDAQSGPLQSCFDKGPNPVSPALPGWMFVATWNRHGKLMAHNNLQCILDHWPEDGVWMLRSWYCRPCGNDTTPHVEPVERRITGERARELVESKMCLTE